MMYKNSFVPHLLSGVCIKKSWYYDNNNYEDIASVDQILYLSINAIPTS